jgi:hypothetical protein
VRVCLTLAVPMFGGHMWNNLLIDIKAFWILVAPAEPLRVRQSLIGLFCYRLLASHIQAWVID